METIPPLTLPALLAGPGLWAPPERQRAFAAAGCRILAAPLPGPEGASPSARRLVELTRQAADGRAAVAGCLAPAGQAAAAPLREEDFTALVAAYARQAEALEEAGADLFLLPGASSMAEARAAVLACRETSDRPVWITFLCDENGRTPSGTDVLAALIVMQGMGADAFGLDCPAGPAEALEQLRRLSPYAQLPLLVRPGLAEGGRPLSPGELARWAEPWAAAGARIFSAGDGAGPEHFAALGTAVEGVDFSAFHPPERDPDVIPCASEREARFITPDVDVGETIECTPDLAEDILEAEEDSPQGALKIAILEEDDLDIFAEHQYMVRDALCLWSDVPELLERALRLYQGRAFWDGTGDVDEDFLRALSRRYGLVLL